MKEYSVREFIARLEGVLEAGHTTLSKLEILEILSMGGKKE